VRTSIAKWAAFGVLIPVVPLLVAYAVSDIVDGPPSIAVMLSGGQLALLATALAARGMGELFGSKRDARALTIFLGGISVAVVLFSAMLYGRLGEQQVDNHLGLFKYSLGTYFFALISSLACVVTAAERDT